MDGCDNCGAILSSAHSFTTTTVKVATCTQGGIVRHTCSCGYYYETTTSALGHTGNEGGTVTQGVSCTQDGYRYMRCTRCHQDYGSPYKYANAYGHDYNSYNIGWVTWDDPAYYDRFLYHVTETHEAYIAAATKSTSAVTNIDDSSSGPTGHFGSRINMNFIGYNNGVNHYRARATVTPGDHYITCTPYTAYTSGAGSYCANAWIATCTRHKCKRCGHTYDSWNPSD